MRKKKVMQLGVVRKCYVVLAMVLGLCISGNAMAIEEAKFEVVSADKPFEVRDYSPSVIAEVILKGDFDKVSNAAFRKLFKYISGSNQSQTKIKMTAPVSQEAASEKISMTAPVSQQESNDGWSVSFMMPASYSMQNIPAPDDADVKVREIAAYRAAVIRYSGSWKQRKYLAKLKLLQDWITAQGLTPIGEPVFARYNAPITPWFMRRNEIVIPVSK